MGHEVRICPLKSMLMFAWRGELLPFSPPFKAELKKPWQW